MNKAEAAEFLGIGIRTLERYMAQGRLAFVRQRGKTGEVVVFKQIDLERLKEELNEPTYQGVIERQASPKNRSELVPSGNIMAEIGECRKSITALIELLSDSSRRTPVHVKPLLTLREAQELSGLPRNFLIESIKTGRVAGAKVGKSWRVRRRDLDRFLAKLF